MSKSNKFMIPLCFIGMMFFTVGFATGINGYFVPFLESNLNLTSAQSYLVIAATFMAFLVFSFPASSIINRIGYKRTMSLAFFMFAIAFYLFIPAARLESFWLYLLACFISGTANTVLQAAINPYVTILGPIDSAARRISIMGICNSLALALPSVFIAAVTGKNIDAVALSDLNKPFWIIIAVVAFLGIITFFAPLEEIKALAPDGIIFTGGPNSVYDESSPHIYKEIFELGIPILGICYGCQLMAYTLGGTVSTCVTSEYGKTEIKSDSRNSRFRTGCFRVRSWQRSCWPE